MATDYKKNTVMEKHIQTILVSIITALALWIGFSVNNQGVAIATLTERVGSLQMQIQSNPSISRDDVLLLISPQRETITDIKVKLQTNSKRLDELEKDLYVRYPNPAKRREQ